MSNKIILENGIRDDRGVIQNILQGQAVQGVSIIESKRGTVRSNHYHREDWHYLYVIRGLMLYRERPAEDGPTTEEYVGEGEMVFTGPLVIHQTLFLEDTVLLCLSKKPKDEGRHDMVPAEM